eukprot:4840016-Karenia_brevis.AAC.1
MATPRATPELPQRYPRVTPELHQAYPIQIDAKVEFPINKGPYSCSKADHVLEFWGAPHSTELLNSGVTTDSTDEILINKVSQLWSNS